MSRLVLLLFGIAIVGCQPPPETAPELGPLVGGPHYFRELSETAVVPVIAAEHRVAFEESSSLPLVFVVHCDEPGRIATLERQESGKIVWLRRFVYDGQGRLVGRETIFRDRSLVIDEIDAGGNIVATKRERVGALSPGENDRT